MEAEIEHAIEIAWNPIAEPSIKHQAFQFVQNTKQQPQSWQTFTSLFIREPRASEVVRVFSLDAINLAIQIQGLDDESLSVLKTTLFDYAMQAYGPTANPQQVDVTHLQNKLCQTFTYLFVSLYRGPWSSFVDDVWRLTISSDGTPGQNLTGVIFYLRLLSSVHDEIADMLLSRSDSEAKRNVEIKDQVRGQDMTKIADSWRLLLSIYCGQNDDVVELVLKLISKWASWMDISLIVDEQMMAFLLPLVGRTSTNANGQANKVRDAAIDALTEIAGKKMKLPDKMQLISILNLRGIVQELVESNALKGLRGTAGYDTDLAEAVAKLVNTVISDVVRVLEDPQRWHGDNELLASADKHLQDFFPFLLRFFSDEYDEVCATVIPGVTDVLTAFRKLSSSNNLPQAYYELLPSMLDAILLKMKFDETASWGDSDEQTDEAEFHELRKRLTNLQRTIASINKNLFVEVLSTLVGNMFQRFGQEGANMHWQDLDLALHEMYLYGEVVLPKDGFASKSFQLTPAAERLVLMVKNMVESGIASFHHPAIILQYMENCVRYASVFEAIPQHIGTVLENFVRLIHHDHIRIKSRSWYLFLRFVKHVRQHVGDVAEQVIEAISDLLPIKAPAPDDDNDEDMSSDEQDNSEAALFTKQLYLFQAIGYLSSSSNIPAEKQALYIRTIMGNLFADMEQHLQLAKTGNGQALSQIDHLVLALGTVAQGFSEGMPSASASSGSGRRQTPDKLVTDEFARTAEAILVALGQFNTSLNIRTACRSAFSRLLGILGGNMLPQLPQWIEGLLSESSGKDEMAFFLRILDQVVFEFKGEIYDVLDQLFAPLQQRIFMALKEPIMGTDDQVQLGELRREYLSFILAILSNNLEGTLVSDRNQVCFEQAIACIMELARAFESSASSSKLAFGLMTRMATIWGGPDVANSGAAPSPAIPNFDQFLVEHFHALCWDVINDPNFRPSDAQSRQILAEIATLEATIWAKTGDLMAHHLRRQQGSSPGTGAFLSTLQEGPNKDRILAFFSTSKTLVRAQPNNNANKGVTTG